MEVKVIKGDTYEQLTVKQVGASPDPRVAGPRIIFDSRLDNVQQSKDHIKQKQHESPPYTLDDKKKLLVKMLSKKDTPAAETPATQELITEEQP